ncbi:MAG: hypothetical protein AAB855_04645 [Patescibacteria group bacterium]
MCLKGKRNEYITYPLLTIATAIGMSVLAGIFLFTALFVGQLLLRIYGVEYGDPYNGPELWPIKIVTPFLVILASPLFPFYDLFLTLFFCEKNLEPPLLCHLSGSLQATLFLFVTIATVLFYAVLGYVIAVCKETIVVMMDSKQGFTFRFSDPWRIVRSIWLLIVVGFAVALLASLNYIPDGFRGIL